MMAGLPTHHILYKHKLMQSYLWRYISSFKRNFSSKESCDDNSSKFETKSNTQNVDEKKVKSSIGTANKSAPNKQSKEEAKKKLLSLLSEIKVSENTKSKPGLMLAKPFKRPTKSERLQQLEDLKSSPEKEIKKAVAAVAESIGGDLQKTENEITSKLSSLNLVDDTADKSEGFRTDNLDIDKNLQENIMSSVKDIASKVPTPVRSKLTERLLKMSEKKRESQPKVSIENTLKGMNIEKIDSLSHTPKSNLPEIKVKDRRIPTSDKVQPKVNIFQSPSLDIFSAEETEIKTETISPIWQSLEKKKLKLLTEFAPANAFEEMIMWTEQGKHWKFPIDNEIDMGEEENVGFHEHVFLEKYLDGFPTKGPVRHFMELVCVGLSKNPYITVERKIENINWFRDYFKEKEDILKDYGAI